jgi:hypothetical protein
MRKLLLATAAGLALAGCPKAQNFINEVQSNTVMVSELITTPAEAVAGQSVPGKVAATVILVTVDPSNPSASSATPITGASVSLQFGGNTVQLNDSDGGAYYIDSLTNPGLMYIPGTNYRFVADTNQQEYAEDVMAPDQEVIQEFHSGLTAYDFDAGLNSLLLPDGGFPPLPDGGVFDPSLLDAGFSLTYPDGGLPGFVGIQAGQNLTLHRPPPDGPATLGVTVVVPLDANFQPQSPSYTSPDSSIQGVLSLIFSPSVYQGQTITIDGTKAWPQCPPTDYVITVTGLKSGSLENSNLFPASAAFAGSADAAPARCTQ